MSQNISLWGASYSAVPSVVLPKTGGGTASFTDVTDTTAAAADVASGKYFYTAAGVRTEGTASGGGGNEFIITVSDDGNGGWTIDKTFAEIYSAYTNGKDIIPWGGVDALTYGEYDSENDQYNLAVCAYDSNADANKWWNYYTNANEPLTLNDVWHEYWTGDADTTAADVASGKIFYTLTGRAVGTASGGGDLKIFSKLAVDSWTCTSSNGGDVSHSLGETPDFVMVAAKSPIMPANGGRTAQFGIYTPMATMFNNNLYQPVQVWSFYYKNNNGVVSTNQYGLYNSNYGFRTFTSSTIHVERPANNYNLGVGDYWVVTGKLKSTYVSTLPT